MGLSRPGQYLEMLDARNQGRFGSESVVGISTQKDIIETKAALEGVSLASYKLFPPKCFAYVPDTSRRGDKVSLAYNHSNHTFLLSSIDIVFQVKQTDLLLPEYLLLYFYRPEFDRYARFCSWGSARETFSWEDLCDTEIDLPPLPVQQKYVAVYQAMLANQQSYEQGLDDLKLVCDAYIEKLKVSCSYGKLGDYIILCDGRNYDLRFGTDSVRGISNDKVFIETKANMKGVSLSPYIIVEPDAFAFVTVTSRNGEKISLARNDSKDTYVCSSSYIVFKVMSEQILMPAYLSMLFERSEFDRYARFHSWGSARETFTYEDMEEVQIPIPSIEVQRAIVEIHEACHRRKEINERLKAQIKDICPILIKGSLDEARREA